MTDPTDSQRARSYSRSPYSGARGYRCRARRDSSPRRGLVPGPERRRREPDALLGRQRLERLQVQGGSEVSATRRSTDERKVILAQQLQTAAARGLRIESQSDFQAVLVEGQPVNHMPHAILTIFTCLLGTWSRSSPDRRREAATVVGTSWQRPLAEARQGLAPSPRLPWRGARRCPSRPGNRLPASCSRSGYAAARPLPDPPGDRPPLPRLRDDPGLRAALARPPAAGADLKPRTPLGLRDARLARSRALASVPAATVRPRVRPALKPQE